MKRIATSVCLLLALATAVAGQEQAAEKKGSDLPYLAAVKTHWDNMLEHGMDVYGPRKTAIWVSCMNAETLVPRKRLPGKPRGNKYTRNKDRVVTSNMYLEITNLRALYILAALADDAKYAKAADNYIRDYLKFGVSRDNGGAICWGEESSYDIFTDLAEIGAGHEELEWSPGWDMLWAIDPAATRQAILATRRNFEDPDDPARRDWWYDRHGWYTGSGRKAVPADKHVGQPWCKHGALMAYHRMYLHKKTGDAQLLRWAKAIADFHWEKRDKKTNLTHEAPQRSPGGTRLTQQGLLAYWLLKGALASPDNEVARELRRQAIAYMKAIETYSYYEKGGKAAYRERVSLDGAADSGKGRFYVWENPYGDHSEVIPYARAMAFFARHVPEGDFLRFARRTTDLVNGTPLWRRTFPEELGAAILLNIDLYELTREKGYLKHAERYGDYAVTKLFNGKLFSRMAGSRFYESKMNVNLSAALLRLHIALDPDVEDPKTWDWSL